jgi:ubiquitin-activating enzyme E1
VHELTSTIFSFAQVVVLTEATRDVQLRVAEVTHPKNIGLIIADTRGVFAQVF